MKRFPNDEDEDEVGTEIGFDHGNKLLDDDAVDKSETEINQMKSGPGVEAQSEGSYMVRVGQSQVKGDGQSSEGSYMQRVGT